MTYWRMQLHPDHGALAVKYTVESLAAGFIGLGFSSDPGDLTNVSKDDLDGAEKNYRRFAHEMEVGDPVLIIAHHFPFAVAEVSGDYNYIRTPVPHLGVWFRHFRTVRNIRYYGDHFTNASAWEQVRMTDTLSPLRRNDTKSYKLIEEMSAAHESV